MLRGFWSRSIELISPHAAVDSTALLGVGVRIDPFAVVKDFVEVGDHCHLHSHSVVGGAPQDHKFRGEPSWVRIGPGTAVREGSTVHRATGIQSATTIGEACCLMTNSHVAHNCSVGDRVTLVSGALLGGHVQLDDDVIVGGNAGIHQYVRIGCLSMIAAGSVVVRDVPPFAMTDRRGRVAGLNLIGLRRAGYTAADRAAIQESFRLIYRSGIATCDLIQVMATNAECPAVAKIIQFLEAPSVRGLCRSIRSLAAH